MLDQNTDRMWYVIGAVLVGAAIILIANSTLPEIFANVTDSFSNVSSSAVDGVDKASQEREKIPFSMAAVNPWFPEMPFEKISDTAIKFGTLPSPDYKGGVYIDTEYFEYGKTYTMAFDLTVLDGDVEGIGGHVFFTDDTNVTINGKSSPLWDKGAWAYDSVRDGEVNPNLMNEWSSAVEFPGVIGKKEYVELTFTRNLFPEQVGDFARNERFYIQPNRTRGHTWEVNQLSYSVLLENLTLYEHIERDE